MTANAQDDHERRVASTYIDALCWVPTSPVSASVDVEVPRTIAIAAEWRVVFRIAEKWREIARV